MLSLYDDRLADSDSYDHFREIANITDLDSPYESAGAFFSASPARSTARRLRRTRQHLGTYRHDLTVAMRVVNNIDRDVMRAEWENWLLDENSRCKQVQELLRDGGTRPSSKKKPREPHTQQVIQAKEKGSGHKFEDLRKWHEEYCGSCRLEQDKLLQGSKNLAFI